MLFDDLQDQTYEPKETWTTASWAKAKVGVLLRLAQKSLNAAGALPRGESVAGMKF